MLKTLVLAAGAAALFAAATPPAKAEPTIALVYPFPDNLVYTQSCKALAEKLNASADGEYTIDVKPFNSVEMFQQAPAVARGSVHMSCIPAAFYARAIPENEAVSTSNASPATVRENGGMEILDQLHQEHMNIKYLGWIDSGPGFQIYMANAPKFNDKGLPDFTDVKMRDNPIYGAFFRALNASTHPMAATEVYPALERGTVDAAAWTTIGLLDFRWQEFLKHVLQPVFYQTDIGVIMNLDAWNAISQKGQETIVEVIEEHESASREARLAEQEDELAQMKNDHGMTFHTVPAADEYIHIAVESAYERMKGRLEEEGRPLEHMQALRERYRVSN